MGEEGKVQRKAHDNPGLETEENNKCQETAVEVNHEEEIAEEYPFKFSWAMLWKFTGPGWLMSIAYLDPGNIEADLQSGVLTGYKLLYILFWATVVGHIMQRLCARIGMVSGKHLAEVCQEHLHPVPNFLLWIMVEIAVIGSDMQEVIGTALALLIISGGYLPIWAGALLTIADTFTFLFLDRYGRRKLEFFFAFLITVMAASFGINYGRDLPDQKEIALGTVWPRIDSKDALITAVSTAGAVIMPHNFYLHSGLVSNRKINRKSHSAVRDANFYTAVEGAIALAISFLINLLVVSVFSHGMSEATFQEVPTNHSSSLYRYVHRYTINVRHVTSQLSTNNPSLSTAVVTPMMNVGMRKLLTLTLPTCSQLVYSLAVLLVQHTCTSGQWGSLHQARPAQ